MNRHRILIESRMWHYSDWASGLFKDIGSIHFKFESLFHITEEFYNEST